MHTRKSWSSFHMLFLVSFLSFLVLTLLPTSNSYGLDHSGNITSDETWYAADNPHIVTGTTHVYNNATLTIEKGCVVKFNYGVHFYIGYYSAAALNAVGTSDVPIIFTSNEDTPAPGDWTGVRFYNSTVDGSTIMDYCTVEYGGYDSSNSNIYCNNASPTIQNCTIKDSDGYGIYCDDNSAPTITNNTIINNDSFPISLYSGLLDSNVAGNTGSGNTPDAIEVRGGNITSSNTWVHQGLYFNVTESIHVYNNATLTIGEGSLVKFDAWTALYIGYYSAGTLIADGTSLNPITFTSNASTPSPGDWKGIVFYNSTVDASTIMDNCTVEYGGGDSFNSNINCNMASPTIQNCTIRHSDGYGIYAGDDSAPTLTNNTISNNGSFPISVYCNMLDSNVTGNTGSGNTPDAIEVRGGNLTDSHTWVKQDFSFNVTSTTHVYGGATLTVEPGCLVKFNSGVHFYIGYYSAAALHAVGTSDNPITFTSNAATPAPGDWTGVRFYNSTDDAATIMDYCTVEYGGLDSSNSNIYCNQASPTIQNCTIRHSDGYGIYCDDNSAPTLTNNTISNNGSFPISVYCNMLDSNVTGNTGSGNTPDAIEVRGGNITDSHTWVAHDLYFNVTSTTHVYGGATLTIPPGCLVKFNSGVHFYIGYYSAAALHAVGTSDNPITFTSNAAAPAPGDWTGVRFYNSTDDAATIMDYCTVEYGGLDSSNSNIYCNMAAPTIQHCIISNSDGYGIHTTGSGADPLISCSTIKNNTHGVYVNGGNPTIENCSISGNTSYGVFNNTSVTIDAENNWWGHSSGPGGVGPGSGNAVSSYVDYTPWLTVFDTCLATITLSPLSDTSPLGTLHTVTATVEDDAGEPMEGIVLFFYITSGPHQGYNGNGTTDSNGQATFTYMGSAEGTDQIVGSFSDFHGRTITSAPVMMTWGYLPPGCTDGDDDGYAAEGGDCGPADCDDNDPDIFAPGVCGCFVADTDTDGDGTPDCIDGCPADPNKVSPGVCGCGIADADSDGDESVDCNDGCPDDPSKQAPGACGCGVADIDADGDGTEDCIDQCPTDGLKVVPGACGCGVPDTDTDGDAVPDCNDGCPDDPDKADPGDCGCGIADTEGDYDGVPDCNDNCPGAYNPDQEDANGNGIGDACDIYFEGFFEPVDNGAVNVAKAGQAIPVKWRLTDASGIPISDPGSFVGLYSYRISCMDFYGDPLDAIEEYASGASGLQYLGDGYWQFNWKTLKIYAGQCRDMYSRLANGTDSPVAQFKFR